jgi:predicted HTH transcriptional regulator
MTEALFYLSIGFVGYVAYALVGDQIKHKPKLPAKPLVAAKPPKPSKPSKTTKPKTARKPAPAKKAKATTTVKTQTAEPVNVTSEAILAYLGKNGQTTIAQLARELPDNRKTIEDSIGKLIKKGAISQTTIRRAKTVALKA